MLFPYGVESMLNSQDICKPKDSKPDDYEREQKNVKFCDKKVLNDMLGN